MSEEKNIAVPDLFRKTMSFFTSRIFLCAGVVFACSLFCPQVFAQPRVARIQPDALAPGMTLAVEIIAPVKETGSFGTDGVYLPDEKIVLVNAGDSERIVFGPVVISWDGRLMQVPVMVPASARPGHIFFQLKNGSKLSSQQEIQIVFPQSKISISGSTIIGDPVFGAGFLTSGNTLVVEELELKSSNISLIDTTRFTLADPDTTTPANPRFHPMTILSRGPVHVSNIVLSVSADTSAGGPGGGGGGAGFGKAGGMGYTGGGSDSSDSDPTFSNIGSGAGPSPLFGGASTTGVLGGATDNEDQGGGGGTGAPFGSSGDKGYRNSDSRAGGFGGGSAGGETPGIPFGGGGGAFASAGDDGAGTGSNSGKINGGKFLAPMQGGSGGGGGNAFESPDSLAGSGGGGGGALSIIGFDDVVIQNAHIIANGAQGGSGADSSDAGGGGGSGGAILLAARRNIRFNSSQLSASGGDGGLGGINREDSQKGGAGGKGIIRLDGAIANSSNAILLGQTVKGITLNIPSQAQGPVFAQLDGIAAVGNGTSDVIRIYCRSPHTSWKFIETNRFLDTDSVYKWKASIPLWYDSLLYVSVMEQIGTPAHTFANYEPDWLLSHISSGIVSVIPRPHIIKYPDSLNVGCIKTDGCAYGSVYLYNEGEKKFTIDTITISNPLFSVPNPITEVGERTTDSIIVKYCPSLVKNDTAVMKVISKDTTLTFVLTGCGSALDVRVSLKTLDLGRVHAGDCDTAEAEVKNIGSDAVKIYPEQLFSGSFEVLSPTDTISITPGSSAFVKVRFCPTDTGSMRGSFILTERRDSLVVRGIGTRKLYGVEDTLKLGKICVGKCHDTAFQIFSRGNDTVTIASITGANVLSPSLPFKLLPYQTKNIVLRTCADSADEHISDIIFESDADSVANTAIVYTGAKAEFTADSLLDFGGLCIGSSDTSAITTTNNGSEVLAITAVSLHGSADITSAALNLPTDILQGSSLKWKFFFDPKSPGLVSDTLDLTLRTAGCDTTLRIFLSGTGSNGEPVFSKTDINFGAVDTGNCADDTITVSNVCPSPITVTLSSVPAPFSIVSPASGQLTLAGGGMEKIVYRYCPKNVESDSELHTITDQNTKQYLVTLRGSGKQVASLPLIRFALASAEAVAGQAFDYTISIDSLAGSVSLNTMSAALEYDPLVFQPLRITPSVSGIAMNGSETKPGRFDLVATASGAVLSRGEFAKVTIMPLLSKHDHTVVEMKDIILAPQAEVATANGSLNVVRCAPPAQNIVIPGDFAFGHIEPNPASGDVSVHMTLGADGALTLSVSNMWGEVVRRTVFTGLTKGSHELHLSLAGLASGEYFITADSWGWRDSQKLIISK